MLTFPIKLAGDFDADGDGLANSIDLDDDADGPLEPFLLQIWMLQL